MFGSGFRAFDHTAQTSGAPESNGTAIHRMNSEHDDDIAAAVSAAEHPPRTGHQHVGGTSAASSPEATRTRTTSLTEGGDVAEEKGGASGSKETSPAKKKIDDSDDIEAADDDGDDTEEERRQSLVQALARHYTNASHASRDVQIPEGSETNPFVIWQGGDEDSPLNPASDNFSSRAWAKAVVALAQESGSAQKSAGVAFQHANVYGFGAATDYQKDVANVLLEAVSSVRGLLGLGSKKRRIDILRDFNGVVRKGEMLVVLGPPGSGCTTLLKTIAGETNGLWIDDGTYFNYQGEFSFFFFSRRVLVLFASLLYCARILSAFIRLGFPGTISPVQSKESARNKSVERATHATRPWCGRRRF